MVKYIECPKCERKGVKHYAKGLCKKCYNKEYKNSHERKKEICVKCGRLDRVEGRDKNDGALCRRCNKKKCSRCKKLGRIEKRIGGLPICVVCYCKERFATDDRYRAKVLIRNRIVESLNKYSRCGKTRKADEYGINYEEIIKYLGSCPGNREEYHIDHIIPISAFDLNDAEQVKKAFAPENHRWLLSVDNLSKGNKYEKEQLIKYLEE